MNICWSLLWILVILNKDIYTNACKAHFNQWKIIFLYFVFEICSRLFNLRTASLICLGWRGGVSPHFSQTSKAARTYQKLNETKLMFKLHLRSIVTDLLQQFPLQRPWLFQTWQLQHSGRQMIQLWIEWAKNEDKY